MAVVKQFSIGCSRTVNLGNFESVRVEASMVVDLEECTPEEFARAKSQVQAELRKLMEETYRNQYADRKKLVG